MLIINLIDYLISTKKTRVYTTFSQEDYYKIVGKLKAASIKYRVAGQPNISSAPGIYGDKNNQYDIYVKKSDEHKALEVIHHG